LRAKRKAGQGGQTALSFAHRLPVKTAGGKALPVLPYYYSVPLFEKEGLGEIF
jgi:hypothetical protein